ncbi:hypothetical protein [Priestia megaterium]|uniref:hypothetical protein n=1 Tax=Priestia megaterium TaxID=1404 RepID=UPI0034D5D2CC
MDFKVYLNANYLGGFSKNDFFDETKVISRGALITITNQTYCVQNVMIRDTGEIILEVS